MENKMTNAKALEYVIANCDVPTDVMDKLNAMLTSLKKKSANRKPTKTQKENDSLKDAILEVLTTEPKTVSEIIAMTPTLAGMNTQKVTPLMYQMEKDGKVVKTTDGKKSLFCKA